MKARLMLGTATALAALLLVTARTAWRPVTAATEPAVGEAAASSGTPSRRAVHVGVRPVPGSPASPAPGPLPEGPDGVVTVPGEDDDLKAYAYVTADLTRLQAGLASTVADAERLTSAADSWSIADVRTAGERLLADAQDLAETAGRATGRVQTLAPTSRTLERARLDALSVYALAADQAYTAISLAEFAISLDVSQATTVAENIEALGRGGDGLTASFAALTATLQQWAAGNPSAVHTALVRYS